MLGYDLILRVLKEFDVRAPIHLEDVARLFVLGEDNIPTPLPPPKRKYTRRQKQTPEPETTSKAVEAEEKVTGDIPIRRRVSHVESGPLWKPPAEVGEGT